VATDPASTTVIVGNEASPTAVRMIRGPTDGIDGNTFRKWLVKEGPGDWAARWDAIPPPLPEPDLLLPLNGSLAGTAPSGPVSATGVGGVQWATVPITESFVDDFARPDTAGGTSITESGLGGAPNGAPWSVTGDYLTARIASGRFVSSGNSYAFQRLPWTPDGMSMRVRWPAGCTDACALIVSADDALIGTMLHWYFGPANWGFQVRQAFGAFVDLAIGSYALAADTDHDVSFRVAGDVATFTTGDGETHVVRDSRIPLVMGPWCTWQIFATSPLSPQIDRVAAWRED
jgi:hypothetical protein